MMRLNKNGWIERGDSMLQTHRREYLIRHLLKERNQYAEGVIPSDEKEQKALLRALFNVRMPQETSGEFLSIQNEYLLEEIRIKGIVDYKDIPPIDQDLYLWRGDITTLRVGAIVNAANSQMLGCFIPNHNCIDNCIHTFAGIQLRSVCDRLMKQQGRQEGIGKAKITPTFNLPADAIIHTVGPIVHGDLTTKQEELLASCYRSSLELADAHQIASIAFCCISTGVFMFPNKRAAEIAIHTVKSYKKHTGSEIEVVFNVFKDEDFQIYKELLG